MKPALLNYVYIAYGYDDLIGISPSGGIDRIREEIKKYNLMSVLQVCAKASTLLVAEGETNKLTQAKLLGAYFPHPQGTRYYNIAQKKSEGTPWVIFYEHNLMTLTKIAIENSSKNAGSVLDTKDLETFGKWLLIINDECFGPESHKSLILPIDYERESIRASLARYHFYMASERLPYKIGRYYWIVKYFRKFRPNGIDIDSLFQQCMNGISLNDYIAVIGSILVKWVTLSKKDDPARYWVTCRNYFDKMIINKKILNKILDKLILSTSEYNQISRDIIVNVLGGRDSYFYNFLPFKLHPLISDNDKQCFVCPSVKYLYDKASEGIYRTIETSLNKNGEYKTRDKFSTAWGEAFEKYVSMTLKLTFPQNYVSDIKIDGDQVLDGLINCNDAIFFIETKSFHWKYKAMVTGDRESMKESLTHLFSKKLKRKGLGQLDYAINLYHQNKIEQLKDIVNKPIIPMLVVSCEIPLDAYNRKFYEEIALEEGSLSEKSDVMPFIILTIEEIEILEAIAKENSSEFALKLIREYSEMFLNKNRDKYVDSSLPFKNFLFEKGYENTYKQSNNSRLLNEMDEYYNVVSKLAFGKKLKRSI